MLRIALLLMLVACGKEKAEQATKEYADKSKRTEAQLYLNKLGKLSKTYHAAEGKFFVGKAGPTPAEVCCKATGQTCAPAAEQWSKDPVWSAFDFMIDEPHRFQYTYESADGVTALATAIGDLDCDGNTITFRLELSVDGEAAKMTIVEPPADAD